MPKKKWLAVLASLAMAAGLAIVPTTSAHAIVYPVRVTNSKTFTVAKTGTQCTNNITLTVYATSASATTRVSCNAAMLSIGADVYAGPGLSGSQSKLTYCSGTSVCTSTVSWANAAGTQTHFAVAPRARIGFLEMGEATNKVTFNN